eukprot:scaffold611264_cov38-Prasinocladus_malaysianus.AAC.1
MATLLWLHGWLHLSGRRSHRPQCMWSWSLKVRATLAQEARSAAAYACPDPRSVDVSFNYKEAAICGYLCMLAEQFISPWVFPSARLVTQLINSGQGAAPDYLIYARGLPNCPDHN